MNVAAPTAEELHTIRITAITAVSNMMVRGDSVLDAINAICDYGSARQAWHDANSGSDDPPTWIDPWKET